LAAALRADGPIPGIARRDLVPLSAAQQRLWFIDQLEGGSTAYHIPLALRLHGELDAGALQSALDALLERHEALRTTFVKVDGQPAQRVNPVEQFVLHAADLRTEHPERREAQLRRLTQQELAASFSLGSGPLIRCITSCPMAGRSEFWCASWVFCTTPLGKAEANRCNHCTCSTQTTRNGSANG
jgi:condensation domain-containing protein